MGLDVVWKRGSLVVMIEGLWDFAPLLFLFVLIV